MMLGQAGVGSKRNQRLETLEDRLCKLSKKDQNKFGLTFESTESKQGQAGFDFVDSLF